MALVSRMVVCSDTTAQRIVGADNMPHRAILHNATKSSNEYIYIGGSSAVSTTNTLHMDPGDTLNLTLRPNDELWAIADPGGLELGVIDIRKND